MVQFFLKFNNKVGVTTAGGVAGRWYYMLKLRLVDLYPIFKEFDLVANSQIKLTMTFNTGFVDITADTGDLMSLSSLYINGSSTPTISL